MKHKIQSMCKSYQMRSVKYLYDLLAEIDRDRCWEQLTQPSRLETRVNCSTHELDVMPMSRKHPESLARQLCREGGQRQRRVLTRPAATMALKPSEGRKLLQESRVGSPMTPSCPFRASPLNSDRWVAGWVAARVARPSEALGVQEPPGGLPGPEGLSPGDERPGQSGLAASERVLLPCRRLTHLLADSPRLLVSSVITPSACTSTTVFIMRPRT